MSFGNFRPAPPRQYGFPVWQTREELLFVLDQYRKWYAEGRTDVEISALMRAKFGHHNPPSFRDRKGKR